MRAASATALSFVLPLAAAASGCGPTVGDPSGAGGTSTATQGSTSSLTSTSGFASSSTSSSSSSTAVADESSTGEPPFEGPGCGEPPPCDRGTFDGHARIESAADLADFAGYTQVTGTLEIMNSEDLVCLDMLACLEVVGWDVRVQDNAALRSTHGLSALAEIGQEAGGGATTRGTVVVAHNAVLERLAGFALSIVGGSLVIEENPLLRVVSGFRELRGLGGLHVMANPNLESLMGLRSIEAVGLCYVSFNDSLCSDEVAEVCGGLEDAPRGTAVYNHPECPALPEGNFPARQDWPGCDVRADDCPLGEKCIVAENETSGIREWVCRPVVAEPAGPHQPCSVFDDPWDGLDTCERNSMCLGDECLPTCRGTDEGFACLSPQEQCRVNSDGRLILCHNVCDPLAQNCADDEGCYAIDGTFLCAESVSPRGEGGSASSCAVPTACDPGLICVNPDVRSDCAGTPNCCTETCDINRPNCPAGLECTALYEPFPSFPANVPRHLENVGFCTDPA